MTVDKPPLALWVQALSVRVFGFNSLAMLVPQALMGVASVGLVYDLVRRRFGRAGGFAAGAVLALTPIAVAVSRHNNPDAMLVLVRRRRAVGRRARAGGRARALARRRGRVRRARLRGQDGRGAAGRPGAVRRVGLGGTAQPRARAASPAARRCSSPACSGRCSCGSRPASERPWISGTSDNSIWSLIMGYNGLGRLDGQAGGPGGGAGGRRQRRARSAATPDRLRLLNEALGGQAGWLLGFALVAGRRAGRLLPAAPERPGHRLDHGRRRLAP